MADLEQEAEEVLETEETPDDISYEQAMEWKKKAERVEKAEKTIVDLKKQLKSAPKAGDEFVSKSEMELERFLDKNPELSEYKEEISKYVSKGLSVKEASLIVTNSDTALQNRSKAEAMNVTGGEGGNTKTTYSWAELEKMPQAEYNKVRDRMDKGEVRIK